MIELLLWLVLAIAGSYIGAIAIVFCSWKVTKFFSRKIEECKISSEEPEKSKIESRRYWWGWMMSAFLLLPAALITWFFTIATIGSFLTKVYGETGYFMAQSLFAPFGLFLFWKAMMFFSRKVEENKTRTQSLKKRLYWLAWITSSVLFLVNILNFACLIGMLLISLRVSDIIQSSFVLYITLLSWGVMRFFSHNIKESNRSLQEQDSIEKSRTELWEKRLYLFGWIISGFLFLWGILKIVSIISFFLLIIYGRTGYLISTVSIMFGFIFLLWKTAAFFLQKVRTLREQALAEKSSAGSFKIGLYRFAWVASGLCLVTLSVSLVLFSLKEAKIYDFSKQALKNAA